MATKKSTGKKNAPVILPENSPVIPYQWEIPDAKALQCLHDGTATPEQQKRALNVIVEKICLTYDLSFRPGGQEAERDTAFAEGKRYVGLQIVKLLKLNLSAFTKKEIEPDDRREPQSEPRS